KEELVDTARDLACPALWQESLERSLARRGRPTRGSVELFHLRAERDLSRPELVRESIMYSQLRRSAATRRPSMALPGARGIRARAPLPATAPRGPCGGRASPPRAGAHRPAAADARLADPPGAELASGSTPPAKATTTTEPAMRAAAPSTAGEPAHVVAARTI